MVKHLELVKITEKLLFLERFLDFLANYLPLWILKFKDFNKNTFLRTPPNKKYGIMNKIIFQNHIISSS